jgi:2-dehydropantoate 2-reductase
MSQKIAVLGTGANGASIAADLINAGLDVVLIEQWPAHVEAMRENGVRIEMPEETVVTQVRAYHLCEVCTFDEPFDVVLLLMKAYDTPWACKLIEPHLAADGLVVGVQNGMSVDAIAEAVGPERTIGCVIEISSQMFEPGIIQRQSPHDRSWFAVGAIHDAARDREAEIQEILSIFGVPIAEAASNPGMREMMVRSGTEALKAGQDLDYRIEPIFGLSEDDVLQTNQLVGLLLDKLTSTYIMDNTITTVLQDHMKNRKSEVGDVNGWVVAEQEKLGKKAPVNAAIVEISARIKRGEVEPGPENLELLKELVAE